MEVKRDQDPEFLDVSLARVPEGTVTDVGLPDPIANSVFTSADGLAVAQVRERAAGTQLWIGDSGSVQPMEHRASSESTIDSIIWVENNRTLLYVVRSLDEREERSHERLWNISVSAGEPEMVAAFPDTPGAYLKHVLLGFTSDGAGVVWATTVAEGVGATERVGVTNIATGRSRLIGTDLDIRGAGCVALSRDGATIYWAKDRQSLLARSVETGADETLYRARHEDLCALVVSPQDGTLLFQDSTLAGGDIHPNAADRTLTLALRDGELDEVRRATGADATLFPRGWSPDGALVWFSDPYIMSDSIESGFRLGRARLWDVRSDEWIKFDDSKGNVRVWVGS